MTKSKRLLALDQATEKTGYSVWEGDKLIKYGLFRLTDITESKSSSALEERMLNVKWFMERMIEEFDIDYVILEDSQMQLNAKVFKTLSALQGVLRVSLYENGIPFNILKPSEWRGCLGIRGRKRSEQKSNALKYVKDKHGIDAEEDVAEAICIGQAGSLLLSKNKLFMKGDYYDYVK